LEKAWKGFGDNDPEMVLACTQAIMQNFATDADKMQAERIADNKCAKALFHKYQEYTGRQRL